MKTAAFFVLSASVVLAADPAPETGPNFNEPARRELPYPLPADFNECVMVVWNDHWRAQLDERIGFYDPPISKDQREDIDRGRRFNWGEYSYCAEQPI